MGDHYKLTRIAKALANRGMAIRSWACRKQRFRASGARSSGRTFHTFCRKESLQGFFPIRRKVLAVGEKGVSLALNEFTIVASELAVFTLSDLVRDSPILKQIFMTPQRLNLCEQILGRSSHCLWRYAP